jgi:hypothetical protein
VFGHTHVESLAPLRRRGAWYANTGTWASHGRDRHVDPRRLPFLSVERDLTAGTPDLVQLRYWDDTALMATVARTVELRRS